MSCSLLFIRISLYSFVWCVSCVYTKNDTCFKKKIIFLVVVFFFYHYNKMDDLITSLKDITNVEDGTYRMNASIPNIINSKEALEISKLVEAVLSVDILTRFVRPLLSLLSKKTWGDDCEAIRKLLNTILNLLSKKHRTGFEEEDCKRFTDRCCRCGGSLFC